MFASDFRKIAREALRGRWKGLLPIFFVSALVTSAFGLTRLRLQLYPDAGSNIFLYLHTMTGDKNLFLLLTLAGWAFTLLNGWVFIGRMQVCCAALDGKPASMGMLFPPKRFGAGLMMGLAYGLVSPMLTLALEGFSVLSAMLGIFGLLVILLAGAAAIVLMFQFYMRLNMAYYILAEHPEMGFADAFGYGWKRMRGRVWRLVCLMFSFTGWMLLSILPAMFFQHLLERGLGVPGVFIAAICSAALSAPLTVYTQTAAAAFFRNIESGKSSS